MNGEKEFMAFTIVEAEEALAVAILIVFDGSEYNLFILPSKRLTRAVLLNHKDYLALDHWQNLLDWVNEVVQLSEVSKDDEVRCSGKIIGAFGCALDVFTQEMHSMHFQMGSESVSGGIKLVLMPTMQTAQKTSGALYIIEKKTAHLYVVFSKEQASEVILQYMHMCKQQTSQGYLQLINTSALPKTDSTPITHIVGPAAHLLGSSMQFITDPKMREYLEGKYEFPDPNMYTA